MRRRWQRKLSCRLAAKEEVAEGWEGKEHTERQQGEGRDCHFAEGDGLVLPAGGEDGPADEPEGDGDGGDSGERAGGIVEVERGGESLGAVGGDGEDAEEEAAEAAGEDRGGDGAVGRVGTLAGSVILRSP